MEISPVGNIIGIVRIGTFCFNCFFYLLPLSSEMKRCIDFIWQ